jgi:competence protein ComEA
LIKEILDFSTYSSGERRGILILIALIVLIILFNLLYPYFVSSRHNDFSAYDQKAKAYLKAAESISKKSKLNNEQENFDIMDTKHSVALQKINPFPFDPNTLDYDHWKKLGLSDKQIKVIENYKSKGGKYYSKEDFKKMYCIPDEEYQTLEPFIDIHLVKPEYPKNAYQKKEIAIVKLDINTADIDDLVKLKGIGDYFAKKIVEYRIKLGGYYSIDQLLEIPKMDTARLNPLMAFLEVNPNYIRKINVNKANFDQLKMHPYLGYNIALSLINYRTKHGDYRQLNDIKNSLLINDKNYFRISHYLCVE